MAAVYVVRSHIGQPLDLGDVHVKPWGQVEVNVQDATPEFKAAVKDAKSRRELQISIVANGRPLETEASIAAVEQAPPPAPLPAPTGSDGIVQA